MWLGQAPSRLFAYTGGKPFDAAMPAVVFLHGAQHDHSVWILQSRFLAHHGFAVLALDLPGHGRSDGPVLPTIEAMAERVAATLAELASPGFVLVGHSMGALIALEAAAQMGSRVAGVAALGAAFPMRVSDALLDATRDDPDAAMQMINVWSHSLSIGPFAVKPSFPAPGFNIVWQNLRLMQWIARRNGPEVLPNDFAACNAYAGGLDAARKLQCPALFVCGKFDQMTPPRSAQALMDVVAQKRSIILASGHALMTETPDGVRDALHGFTVATLRAAPA
jgi:pimeloyl-ACP methyl ester carboxylesterase